ncbi:UDP-glucose dehydrogenase family protein [Aeromicrobium sp. HA]|uniref:UDP-glucose dehydrogenase family protein n=1 Tax=Aeromicrobium sp. HA TaxID=3009077 RepID=UPI0022B052BB|nr:UDP-glucose/GDP-mannose dehydrogenase family protein [Aeromicrobium sp. HA]
MKISVIGCGYLGAVHAASMAELGHEVVGVDTDLAKIESLSAGRAPFFEPNLPELLERTLASGRLSFTTDFADVADAQVHFLCVGTPQKRGEYAADLAYVDGAFTSLLEVIAPSALVAGKSTVPVGTAERLAAQLAEVRPDAMLVWNPEFLREGFAVKDTLHPDRLVYGVPDGGAGERATALLDEVYAAILAEGTPRLTMDPATAQLVKVAANSFLATKISFINAMAELCERTDADVTALADAIGLDDRIGRKFLNAGLGFGGGCLPKDIRAFMARAGELGADQTLSFLAEVDAINTRRRVRMVDLAREECGGSLMGRTVAVLGASFKPDSDDIRDSPALNVAEQLRLQGANVRVTDPAALGNAKSSYPNLLYVEDTEEALTGADLVLLLTEWREYRELDPEAVGALVRRRALLDGRNAVDPDRWRAAGWTYRALGRRA